MLTRNQPCATAATDMPCAQQLPQHRAAATGATARHRSCVGAAARHPSHSAPGWSETQQAPRREGAGPEAKESLVRRCGATVLVCARLVSAARAARGPPTLLHSAIPSLLAEQATRGQSRQGFLKSNSLPALSLSWGVGARFQHPYWTAVGCRRNSSNKVQYRPRGRAHAGGKSR